GDANVGLGGCINVQTQTRGDLGVGSCDARCNVCTVFDILQTKTAVARDGHISSGCRSACNQCGGRDKKLFHRIPSIDFQGWPNSGESELGMDRISASRGLIAMIM